MVFVCWLMGPVAGVLGSPWVSRMAASVASAPAQPRVRDARALVGLAPAQVAETLPALAQVDTDVIEALQALGSAQPVAAVAASVGVSTRSLQRLLQGHGLPVPAFWRQLGRARAAARLLVHDLPLAELAADAGYSDQAHLTRAMGRWFGATPQRLRAAPSVLTGLCQPGLGNWTGEQISTK